jgi:RimJ/RimL family protein N-acetyltransferase
MGRLSAQCTDKRVNIVSKELFEKFPTAEAMANGDISEIENIVKPCGLYRMKADNLREASRLLITEFTMDMAEAVHLNSLDEDNRRFVPDEVFETVEEAADTVGFLMGVYETGDGPLVYPALLKDGTYIGYVQAVPFDDGTWEIGYHIGANYTKRGYATEAVKAFLPEIMPKLGLTSIKGICRAENKASVQVMERCGFIKEYEGLGPYQGQERPICRYTFTL